MARKRLRFVRNNFQLSPQQVLLAQTGQHLAHHIKLDADSLPKLLADAAGQAVHLYQSLLHKTDSVFFRKTQGKFKVLIRLQCLVKAARLCKILCFD